ncbi:TPA: hypothetical protein ACF3IQ_000333 [Enterobacter hormaechei]|nr:hypothetical protein [Enterobacter hormaechei]
MYLPLWVGFLMVLVIIYLAVINNKKIDKLNDELIRLNAMLTGTNSEIKDNLYDARFMIKTNQLLIEELYRTDLTTKFFCSNIYNTAYRTSTTIQHIDEELQFHLKGYSRSENTIMDACKAVESNKADAPVFADMKMFEIKDGVTISKI